MTRLQQYVVGFAIDHAHRVALIRKNRPAWQAGKLNGVGGHVEPGETPLEAMVREFAEETGVAIVADEWELFVLMEFPGAIIHFYRARVGPDVLDAVRSTTDEHVQPWHIGGAWRGFNPLPNLLWLVPLAAYTADRYEPIVVHASVAEVLEP